MPLYRWNTDNLEAVPTTTFESEGLKEREDLQRLLRDQPDVLEEGLFIVAEEYGDWQDSNRSIDLLALDTEGRLVVIELKRTRTGEHSELQAIRYAAMVSNMTFEQIVDAHSQYLANRGIEGNATSRILAHLGAVDEADVDVHTERPRIILASAGFSAELTTSVLWLRDGGMDVSCIKLQLYRSNDGLMLDTSQLIPLPEAADYLVKVREREEGERRPRRNSPPERIPGGDAFLDAIQQVREDYGPMLTELYEWAISLERENLTILETRRGSWNTSLRLSLPNADVRFVIIYKSGSLANYDLMESQIRTRAPNANARIEQLLGPEIYSEGKYPNLKSMPPDGLLDALTDAYREANELPPTTPRPESVPGSPVTGDC